MAKASFRRLSAVLLVAVALVAGACGANQQAGTGSESGSPTGPGAAAPGAGGGGAGGALEGRARAAPLSIQPDVPDVPYCEIDGTSQLMDIYLASTQGPNPVVLFVHGGAWLAGDKHMERVNPETGTQLTADWITAMNNSGITVAAANYSLAPRYKFPRPIEDVKCAVRFLRAEASTYDIDPDRVGAMGGSAGGHLVALLGTTDESAGWDVGPNLDQSSRVQAVVDLFGPTDLARLSQDRGINLSFAFGSPANYETYSPLTYVTPDDAPTLILQGAEDPGVAPVQSQEFSGALQAAGVPSKLVMVENAGHGFVAVPAGATIDPSIEELQREILNWFQTYLSG